MEDYVHKKCSSKLHKDVNANSYCQECRIYMCEKCHQNHQEFYEHNQLYINENQNEIFTGICNEKGHINYLDFFCKTHNKLCCLACVSNINKNGYGQHKNCDICIIEDVKEEKKIKFKENIKEFENLSNSVTKSINQLKNTFEDINEKKEEMKIQIQKIFTKIRNGLNIREDQLIVKIDEKFDNSFIEETNIKQYEKLPKQIQRLLEEINSVNKEWDISNLNYFLNCCSDIEQNIIKIKKDNQSLQNCISSKIYKIDYTPNDSDLQLILEKVKNLGKVFYEYEFEPCKNIINEMPEYILSGERDNIITKISGQNWIRILSKNTLEPEKEYNFKIKIIKSRSRQIMIGIAQRTPEIINKDFINIIKSIHNQYGGSIINNNTLKKKLLMFYLFKNVEPMDIMINYGWYFCVSNSSLYSDCPHNYRAKAINYKMNQDEIKININMKEGTFNLLVDDDKFQLYNTIPLNKPISPSILLLDEEDSIEILPI